MKLRLFALRNTASNKILDSVYFSDKQAAKKERDALNKEAGASYVVTPGPDHRKNKS